MSELCVVCGKPEEGHFQDTPDDMGCGRFGKYLPPSAIVLAWLSKPEVERAVHRVLVDPATQGCPDVSISECVVFALRQLAEEGK